MRGTIENHYDLCKCPSADCGWLGHVGESDAMDLPDLSGQTSVCPHCAREVVPVTTDELRRELALLPKASYWKGASNHERAARRAAIERLLAE